MTNGTTNGTTNTPRQTLAAIADLVARPFDDPYTEDADVLRKVGELAGLSPVRADNGMVTGMQQLIPDEPAQLAPARPVDGWNNHGYWVGAHAEPSIAARYESRIRVLRARCGGPAMCRSCGTGIVTVWPHPGRHAQAAP